MYTSLNKIKACHPCRAGWRTLLLSLGKIAPDDEPLSIEYILGSNGLDDALWCLRAVEGCDREIRLYAVWCARQVQGAMTDPRSVAALDVAEQFAHGSATCEELRAAWDAAWDATKAAAWAATGAAAWDAARAAAWAAAGAAAGNAAWAAAGDATKAAAWAATGGAAGAAARAASGAAAGDAAKAAQADELLRVCRATS